MEQSPLVVMAICIVEGLMNKQPAVLVNQNRRCFSLDADHLQKTEKRLAGCKWRCGGG